jgi:hypothetical protein
MNRMIIAMSKAKQTISLTNVLAAVIDGRC